MNTVRISAYSHSRIPQHTSRLLRRCRSVPFVAPSKVQSSALRTLMNFASRTPNRRRFGDRKIKTRQHPSLIPVSPALGAVVQGIDLSKPLNQNVQKAIQEGLDERSALVFRGQHVAGHQMVKSLNFLGHVAIEQHYVDQGLTLEGCPECFVLKNDKDNPPLFDFWHSDKTAWEHPVKYTVLSCQQIPDIGGDTLISNTRKVFQGMSSGMQEIFRRMKGVYNERIAFVSNAKIVNYLKNKGFDAEGVYEHFKDQVHPIVLRNSRNGEEALYFSPPYFSHMEGFSKDESTYFLNFLLNAITKPEFVYRHHWKKGDLLIFDNFSTSHYAAADFFPAVREMHRISITGEANDV